MKVFLLAFALLLAAPTAAEAARRQLVVDGQPTLRVWVVSTPDARAEGVKGHPLSPGEGLWFSYPADTSSAFWMQGVSAPLLLVWIGSNHRVIGIRRMEPCPNGGNKCPLYRTPWLFRSALELLPGDLRRSGLKPGSVVRLRPVR